MSLQNENALNALRISVKYMATQLDATHNYITIIQNGRNEDSAALSLTEEMQKLKDSYANTMSNYKKLCELQNVDFNDII